MSNPTWTQAEHSRCLCSLGSGEVVHVVSFVALPGFEEPFDATVSR